MSLENFGLDESFQKRIPQGDSFPRDICAHCGFIHYINPKIVVGTVVRWQEKYLLCKRSIEPRLGFWTVPAGFMEQNETTEAGAVREAREEALAEIEIDCLLGIYNIPRISQVQIFYRGTLGRPGFGPGEESLEAELYSWESIPWQDLAFPSVTWALRCAQKVRDQRVFTPFTEEG